MSNTTELTPLCMEPNYNDPSNLIFNSSSFNNMTTAATNVTMTTTSCCTSNLEHINIMLALHRPNLLLYDKYLCFVWFILGFPGNFLSFFVWIRRKMRPSSGCYLAALAFNDFIFLLFNVVNKANFAWETNILNVPVFCEVFPVIFYSTQYLSLFFVLAFTVERYISVCHPYQRERYCTMQRAIAVIVSLTVFTLLLHSVLAYVYYFDGTRCRLRDEFVASQFYNVYTIVCEITTFAIVPCVIIIINVRVIVEIKRVNRRVPGYVAPQKFFNSNSRAKHFQPPVTSSNSFYMEANVKQTNSTKMGIKPVTVPSATAKSKFRKNVSHTSSGGPQSVSSQPSGSGISQSATTVMLLAVSFFYIISTLPVTISIVTLPKNDVCRPVEEVANDDDWQVIFNYWTARVVVQELGISHYACNIIFYLLTGNLFRAELKLFLAKLFCRPSLKKIFHRKSSSRQLSNNKTSNNNNNTSFSSCNYSNTQNNMNDLDDDDDIKNRSSTADKLQQTVNENKLPKPNDQQKFNIYTPTAATTATTVATTTKCNTIYQKNNDSDVNSSACQLNTNFDVANNVTSNNNISNNKINNTANNNIHTGANNNNSTNNSIHYRNMQTVVDDNNIDEDDEDELFNVHTDFTHVNVKRSSKAEDTNDLIETLPLNTNLSREQ